jgi:ribA/ribD-fused uncharacterized protein
MPEATLDHDSLLVTRAKALAISMHDGCGHTRSDGEPYWRHPERVVETLLRYGRPPTTIAAAWLHDVPEDCPPDGAGCEALLERIASEFGPEVGALVREVTNFSEPDASMEEKQARLREHAKHMTAEAKWLKLADRLDNISGMAKWSDEKRVRYATVTTRLLGALEPIPTGAEPLADAIRVRADDVARSAIPPTAAPIAGPITRFDGEFRFLSNFFPVEIRSPNGYRYPTIEHAYQCAKTNNEHQRARVASARGPKEARRRGRKLQPGPEWIQRRLEVMRTLLAEKFRPGTELARQLLATGDVELVDGNELGDTFWGISDGVGENHLGRLLMARRTELRELASR